MSGTPSVTVLVPAFNGERTIGACLGAILPQLPAGSEVIIIDDGGIDRTLDIVRGTAHPSVRIIQGRGAGVAAALNDGILASRHDIICQIDQDVTIDGGWFERILPQFSDRRVAAVQGRFTRSHSSRLLARCAAIELLGRYAEVCGDRIDHVCTGNSAYRAEALRAIGLFDESLGYGDDNDVSYRLRAAGFELRFCREATASHDWPATVRGYLKQQFGLGYGRLDVIAKHPRRVTGDAVSGSGMIAHAAVAFIACALLSFSATLTVLIVAALAIERLAAGIRTWLRHGDRAAIAFPAVHLLRDLAWATAIAAWIMRRLLGHSPRARHSMPRGMARLRGATADPAALERVMAIIPAFNERSALPSVIADLQAHCPQLRVVVVDDGSTDDTCEVADRLGCETLRLPIRFGVGSAIRAGIRYARQRGYDVIIRIDGDGQHAAADIPRVLAPVLAGTTDAAIGVRNRSPHDSAVRSMIRLGLSLALLVLLRRRVRDPTSGFWAFGRRATELLAAHHPTGYPEPELHVLLNREGLATAEVPVRSRERIAGRTSLTPWRAGMALGRALLAMIVVPLRPSGGARL